MSEKKTLRDEIAIAALPSIITYMDLKLSQLTYADIDKAEIEKSVAETAYSIADAMLAARK